MEPSLGTLLQIENIGSQNAFWNKGSMAKNTSVKTPDDINLLKTLNCPLVKK